MIVDGAVIIVEAIVHRLQVGFAGQKLSALKLDQEVEKATLKIRNSAAFGEIIILMVYIPILALVGIEGKMFKPMAQTVMLAIGGALVLSLTYVPMMSALCLSKNIQIKKTIADRLIHFFQKIYTPVLQVALRLKALFVLATIALFAFSLFVFSQMGGEFIPVLEEGDLALHQILPPGSSLSQSVEVSKIIQEKLLQEFPEIVDIVTKIGSSEIPTDPMPVETGDIMVILKPKAEWTTAKTRQGLFNEMEKVLLTIPGLAYEFSQPIQMRFNELMTGSRADIAVKLFGQDLTLIYDKAKEAEKVIRSIDGVGTIKVEQTVGMPQIVVNFKYDKMAQYGLQVKTVNQVIRTAFAGEKAGTIYEGDRRFDLVVRLEEDYRNDISHLENLYITLENGSQLPLQAVANVELIDAPMQISRENTNRKIVIGVNVGDRDTETLVEEIQAKLDAQIELPPGYYFNYGGQFENLKAANARLSIAVPVSLALIFVLLFLTFGSVAQAALIFTAIPLSAIGGIWALQLRDMPFSISAGIGFIALFGVAVLNGIVLIGYFNQLKEEGMTNIRERIFKGTEVRLRPVLMTAMVASLGFLPMALSTSGGAGVQRPLATVVIGGLISATFLTLVVLPILYSWLANWQERKGTINLPGKATLILLPFLFFQINSSAQTQAITLDEALTKVIDQHPRMRAAQLQIEQGQVLQNLKYAPGTTNFNYQGDGLFRRNGQQVNQIGIQQNFPNPASTKARNLLQEEIQSQSALQGQWSANELKLQVRHQYSELQQRKELRSLYQELIVLYEEYYQVAQNRARLGAANKMEPLTLRASLNEYQLLLRQVNLEINSLEKSLQSLIREEDAVTTADSLILEPILLADGTNVLQVQLADQSIQLEMAKKSIIASKRKPDFSIGYAAQNYFEEGWLSGIQAGIQVPLFNKQNRKRVEAQDRQVAVAQANAEATSLQVQQELRSLYTTISLYAEGAVFYQNQLAVLNPEMERISNLNYQAGEISYLELLNTLQLIAQNNISYWQQVLAHNKALALYQFHASQ